MSNTARGPVFVSAEVAGQVFDWKAAVAALQSAYGNTVTSTSAPPRTIAASGDAWLRVLPAVPSGERYFGAKLMGMATGAPDAGVQYVIVLFDRTTSRIAAFVDADKVTAYRTAATSAAAVDKLAPKRPARLAVLGSGLEAAMHARAFAAVRQLSELVVFSPTAAKREAFARELGQELGVPTRAAASGEEAVRGADVVLAAARSHGEKPILFGDWIQERALTVSIGSTIPAQREIDASVVQRSDLIVCDVVHEVLKETGDMIAASQAGIDASGRSFSLDALMQGQLESRLAESRYPMFKSVGNGLQDVVVAGLILDRAIASGLATELPISISVKRI